MRLRKRMIAAILAAMMVISSLQLPGGTAHAEELSANSLVNENGDETGSVTDKPVTEDRETDPESAEAQETSDLNDASDSAGEDQMDNESGPEGEDQVDNESESAGEDYAGD